MHPLEFWRTLRRRGLDLRTTGLPEGRKGRGWHARAEREILASIERRLAQALAVLGQGSWDLLLVHFQAADTAGHHFTRYFDATSPRYDGSWPGRARVIPAVYEALDRAVDRLCEACGKDTTTIVLSDHGMGPASDRVIYLNRWLEEQGLLVTRTGGLSRSAHTLRRIALRRLPREAQARLFRGLRGTLAPRLETRVRLRHLDLEASAAFSEESSTLPGVWIRDGARTNEIFARLRNWDAVERVLRREEVYTGPGGGPGPARRGRGGAPRGGPPPPRPTPTPPPPGGRPAG